MSWVWVLALAAGSYALKAAGPMLLRERSSAPGLTRLATLLTPALLAALVAVQTFADGRSLTLDARAAGLATAVAAIALRAPFVVVVALAALVTALVRAFG